jgi:phosphonate transport system substrate-binding protein
MKCLTRPSLICAILLTLFNSASAASKTGQCSQTQALTFGILPFVSAEQLVIRFTPLVNYLSHHLNTRIRIETAPNFVEFYRRTTKDKRYDILFTAPHFFPEARAAGYRLIASVDSPGMKAVFVVPKKSSIQRIKDLKGKRLATVDETSLATLLVKKHLIEHGINPDTDLSIVTTPTHNASLLSSYHGVTDASALMQPPYNAASDQVRNSMRIIGKTRRAPHIPISVSPKMTAGCATEISRLLLNMSANQDGRDVLQHNRFSGFRLSRAEEYEKFRTLILHQ